MVAGRQDFVLLEKLKGIFFLVFIYLVASGLTCGTLDLHRTVRSLSLPCADSLAASHGLSGCSAPA